MTILKTQRRPGGRGGIDVPQGELRREKDNGLDGGDVKDAFHSPGVRDIEGQAPEGKEDRVMMEGGRRDVKTFKF